MLRKTTHTMTMTLQSKAIILSLMVLINQSNKKTRIMANNYSFGPQITEARQGPWISLTSL